MTDAHDAPKPAQRMEERLYKNRYLVDEGRPHVKLRRRAIDSDELKSLVRLCPAGCYTKVERGRVELSLDGCMECGTCRIVCQATGEIEWSYPRGGFGVAFKFG